MRTCVETSLGLIAIVASIACGAVQDDLGENTDGLTQWVGTASASNTPIPNYQPSRAIDGSTSTWWLSGARDNEWWQLDLGQSRTVTRIEIVNGGSRARTYRVGFSTDGVSFSNLADQTSTLGLNALDFPVRTARYIRVTGLSRMDPTWSWSIIEFRAFGPTATAASPTNTELPAISGTIQAGAVVSTSAGAWTGSPTGYSYQWQRCDAAGCCRWPEGAEFDVRTPAHW